MEQTIFQSAKTAINMPYYLAYVKTRCNWIPDETVAVPIIDENTKILG